MTARWTNEALDRFASTVATAITATNELVTANSQAIAASNDRLTRMEQMVESNNRFLESFSQDVKQLTQNTDKLIRQMQASTASANQDRMDVTTRLSAINRKVDAIATKANIPSKKGWRQQTLDWMDSQVEVAKA